MAKLREQDEQKAKEKHANIKRLSLGKRKAKDHQALRNDQTSWQHKHRRIENAADRLNAFKDATLHNAISICTCCHQRMFKSNVRIFTTELANQLNSNSIYFIFVNLY